jgi:hypothetical protein
MHTTKLSLKGGIALHLFGLSIALTMAQPVLAATNAPTQADVAQVMKSNWDKSANSFTPKAVLTLNSVRFGKAAKATMQEYEVEGIPKGEMVTPAIVDFTVRTYYSSETKAVRRVREARVYKDKMDEWAVMTGSVKGQDTTTKEPAVK